MADPVSNAAPLPGPVAWRFRFHTDDSLAGKPNVRGWVLTSEWVNPFDGIEVEPLYTASHLQQRLREAEEVIETLVNLKDLRRQIADADLSTYGVADAERAQELADEYARRSPLAWSRARSYLSSRPKE